MSNVNKKNSQGEVLNARIPKPHGPANLVCIAPDCQRQFPESWLDTRLDWVMPDGVTAINDAGLVITKIGACCSEECHEEWIERARCLQW